VRKRWDGVYCQGGTGKDKNGVAQIVSFDLVRIKMGWSTMSGGVGNDKDGVEYIVRLDLLMIKLGWSTLSGWTW
jgi:hypothetical protein